MVLCFCVLCVLSLVSIVWGLLVVVVLFSTVMELFVFFFVFLTA